MLGIYSIYYCTEDGLIIERVDLIQYYYNKKQSSFMKWIVQFWKLSLGVRSNVLLLSSQFKFCVQLKTFVETSPTPSVCSEEQCFALYFKNFFVVFKLYGSVIFVVYEPLCVPIMFSTTVNRNLVFVFFTLVLAITLGKFVLFIWPKSARFYLCKPDSCSMLNDYYILIVKSNLELYIVVN